jgi:cellulose biosynthesis protein BcsQ
MKIPLTVFIPLLILILVIAVVLLARLKAGKSLGKYKARKLMTENELEFFGRLVTALPDHYIFPQVSMTALLEASSGDRKIAHSDRLRIAQQRVDYVVCDVRCEVVAVVELDDRTHSSEKDQRRDKRLEQAGIRTIRFQSRSKPQLDAIRASVLPVSTPAAPANNSTARAANSARDGVAQT